MTPKEMAMTLMRPPKMASSRRMPSLSTSRMAKLSAAVISTPAHSGTLCTIP